MPYQIFGSLINVTAYPEDNRSSWGQSGKIRPHWWCTGRVSLQSPSSSFLLATPVTRGELMKSRAITWWRHQMETISALLTLCVGNSPVTGEFPSQRSVTRSSDVFFDLRLNKRLSKQSWGWWFETPSRSLWRHCNEQWCLQWGITKIYDIL